MAMLVQLSLLLLLMLLLLMLMVLAEMRLMLCQSGGVGQLLVRTDERLELWVFRQHAIE